MKLIANVLDFTLSIPLYVAWFVGDVITRGGVSRAIVRALMNPPGIR